MKHLLLPATLLFVVFAGCVADETEEPPMAIDACAPGQIDAEGVRIVGTDFDVSTLVDTDPWDFQTTNLRTCSIEKVGHTPLRFTADGQPDPHNYLGEIDMRGDLDLGVVSALGSSETPTVYLVDISDRADPIVLSTIEQAGTYIVDVKISDDGDYLFTASQNLPTVGEVPIDPAQPDVFAGFSIYDITDRTAPVFVQSIPSPDDIGCHMISHEIIDGTDVVFCVGQQVHAHGLVRTAPGLPFVYLGRFSYMLPDGDGTLLPGACINDVIVAGDPTGLLCSGPHDMTVRQDEVDGSTYMIASHWNEGVRVVDVSNPVNDGFVTVASWDGEGATHYDGNVHSAMMFWLGDQRYVVASPEMTYGGVVPSMWILDATVLDGPMELIAEWYHPAEVPTPGLLHTTHQWQVAPTGPDATVENATIYLTMNHWGLWALDFEDMLAGDMQGAIRGIHMSRAPLDQSTAVGNAILSTWDVNVVDGYIYGSDRATGLWVFDYTEDGPFRPELTGFA